MTHQVIRGVEQFSDHDALVITLKNAAIIKESEKYFIKNLNDDPELLAFWQNSIVELNNVA